jgi:hypothetical protein
MSSRLREALLRCDAIAQLPEIREYKIVKEMRNIINGALDEPLRNCDVGTEYEQSERLAEFCRHHQKGCGLGYGSKGIGHPKVTCPAFKNIECSIVWALMPYEEVSNETIKA